MPHKRTGATVPDLWKDLSNIGFLRRRRHRPHTPSPPPEPTTPMLIYGLNTIRLKADDEDDSSSRNLGRQANPTRPTANQQPSRTNTSSPSANSPSSLYPSNLQQAQTPTPPSAPSASMSVNDLSHQSVPAGRKPPFFFREDYVGFIVKGNFMTLAAKPTLVEEGEWLSHQVVEQNRLLSGMIKIVQTEDRTNGTGLCNEKTCPTMSAGGTTYTWIDTNRNPINLPAPTYIKHIQTWVAGKIQDETVFPTATFSQAPPLPLPQQVANDPNHWLGKASGFPQRFEIEIKNMYKQMFRCYAHLYWSHWLQFWELNAYRDLNTCFMHFVNVGRIFGLLSERDTEPMQPLIDLWVRRGDLPSQNTEGDGRPASAATAEGPKTPAAAAGPAAPAPVV